MEKTQIIFLMLLLSIFKFNNGFSQDFDDSLKLDTKYQQKVYQYFDKYGLDTILDCSRKLDEVYTFLRIDSIKRYYKVHDIYIYENLDGKKFYFIEISDLTGTYYWTLITEYVKGSCKNKIRKNHAYYMEIDYFEDEKFKQRVSWEYSHVNYHNNYKIIIHDIEAFYRFVYSPNLIGRCFIP